MMHGTKHIVSKAMVYGIQKNLFSEPYFDLLALFKKRLIEVKKCLVIGYAFGDPWINQIFLDAVKGNPTQIKIGLINRKSETKLNEIPMLNSTLEELSPFLEDFLELPNSRDEDA